MSAFKKYTRTLAANTEQVIDVSPSNVIICTAGDYEFIARPDGQNPCSFETGIGINYDRDFTKVRIKSTNAQTVSLYIGSGDIQDNRLVGNVDISGGIRIASNRTAAYGNVTIGTSAAVIKAANTTRATCLVQNLSANDLYIGNDASVTTSNGTKVGAGGSISVTFDDAIYGIATAASSDIRYLDESL